MQLPGQLLSLAVRAPSMDISLLQPFYSYAEMRNTERVLVLHAWSTKMHTVDQIFVVFLSTKSHFTAF